ncbi:MAG TPA: hypothetical protein VN698_00710, partial [Bacteroidia bacterium]|nr:hypothetical protein [Bacteroidia bacterium]
MGFFLGVLLVFVLTAILLLFWLGKGNIIYLKLIGIIWLGVFGLFFLGIIVNFIKSKKELKKTDYYGQYIINRAYFKGKQADWQYNTYRFEIKENDTLYFYVTDKDKIVQTYKGKISTTAPYSSERLIVEMVQPYHVLNTNPTLYRSAWSFYLVFNSPKYN